MRTTTLMILFLNIFINVCIGQLNTKPLFIGEQFELYSKYKNRNYKISVCLPQNYEKDTTRYACLYLFYGEDAKFLVASGIATALSDATWQIPRLIIVGVTNMQWFYDLTPIPVKGLENKSGGGKEFLSFVTEDLLKTIDSSYRTNGHKIFMGHSLAGLLGVQAFVENPNYFNDYILISPSIAERADYIADAFKQKIINSKELKNKFYFSVGSEESRIMKGALWLQEGLEAKKHDNLKWKFEMHQGHNHSTVVPISLMNGLLFILGK